MKILFLRPHSNVPSAPAPLGLLSLIGYARKYGGYNDFTIVDGRGTLTPAEGLRPQIRAVKPDLIGITAFSMERAEAHELARVAKEEHPNVPLVIGGPYTTGEFREVVADPNVDYAVVGEGEITFLELLKNLEKGIRKPEIKGLAYQDNGEFRFLGFPEFIKDLDQIPMVAWDALDLEFYFKNKRKRSTMNPHPKSTRSIPLFTTRGCPYQCTYCHQVFGKKLRKRSVEHVMEELIYLKRNHDLKEVDIIDDIFNLDLDRAKKICDRMVEEKLKLGIAFPNALRADRMDEELIDKLVKAGAYRFIYAIESASPRIQKMIKKNLNLERAREVIEYTAKKNVSVGGYFMIGFLDETEEEMQMTFDFAINSPLVTTSFFILQPFPHTQIWDQAIAAGHPLPQDPQEHYYRVSYNISQVPIERINHMRTKAIRKFHFNLWRIYRFFRTTPFRNAVWTKIKMMLMFLIKENPEEGGSKL